MVMADLGYFLVLWIWFLRLLMIQILSFVRACEKLQCFDFVSRFFGKTAQLYGERNSQPTPMNYRAGLFFGHFFGM